MSKLLVSNIWFGNSYSGIYTTSMFGGWGISSENHVNDLVACKMGFRHVMDYLRNYPGHYTPESRISNIVGYDDNVGYRHWFSITNKYHSLKEVSNIFDRMIPDIGITYPYILYPTIENISKSLTTLYPEDIKYRWFCSDWDG